MAPAAAPLIVPVFLPHAGCPHRCVFCDQERITGHDACLPSFQRLRASIDGFLANCRPSSRRTQIAFYGGNFLGLPPRKIQSLLGLAGSYVDQGKFHGIRFSTRPDTIDPFHLDLIREYPVETVEIGAQSMDEAVLHLSSRGHSAADTRQAVSQLKDRGYAIGLQVMVGLPGDNGSRAMASARDIAALEPDFVRIYPTLVLEGSPLAVHYARGHYAPWSLERSISTVKDMYLIFKRENIPVIRMGLQATTDLDARAGILAGPYHPAFGHLVLSRIFLDNTLDVLAAADIETALEGRHIRLSVHPRSLSRLRGHRNENMTRLKLKFGLTGVEVRTDPLLHEEEIKLDGIVNPLTGLI